jgi:hypothetical protein
MAYALNSNEVCFFVYLISLVQICRKNKKMGKGTCPWSYHKTVVLFLTGNQVQLRSDKSKRQRVKQ